MDFKKLIPIGNLFVCIKTNQNSESYSGTSFVYKKTEDDVPEYKIVDMAFVDPKIKNEYFMFNEGDVVYSASTGTEVVLNGVKYYLFKPEHIIGKKI